MTDSTACRPKEKKKQMARMRMERRANVMKMEGVNHGERGEREHVAKSQNRKRKRVRKRRREPKRRRWLTVPAVGRFLVASGKRAGHVGEHCREYDECPVATVGPHGRSLIAGTELEKRENGKRDRRRVSQDSLPPRADLLSALLAQRRLRRTLCSPLYQQDRHSSRYVSHRGPYVSLG